MNSTEGEVTKPRATEMRISTRDRRVRDLRKMVWLMPRMAKAVPYLGSIVVAATKRS